MHLRCARCKRDYRPRERVIYGEDTMLVSGENCFFLFCVLLSHVLLFLTDRSSNFE